MSWDNQKSHETSLRGDHRIIGLANPVQRNAKMQFHNSVCLVTYTGSASHELRPFLDSVLKFDDGGLLGHAYFCEAADPTEKLPSTITHLV